MPNYIRPKIVGPSVFLTIALAARGSDLLVREVDTLRRAVRLTRATRPFRIDAWVVLPDHMHCVWTLPDGDSDFSGRIGQIKASFSKTLPAGPLRASHVLRREKGIWQRRFWEHHACNIADFSACISYCWENPVKHGLVTHAADWPYSSWHRDRPDA